MEKRRHITFLTIKISTYLCCKRHLKKNYLKGKCQNGIKSNKKMHLSNSYALFGYNIERSITEQISQSTVLMSN